MWLGKIHRFKWQTRIALSSRTCRQKLDFCVVTGNVRILTILLLAYVRVHIGHCSGSSGAIFERRILQKHVQIVQQNVWFCQNRSEKSLLLKTRILKILQGFSLFFEDRKRHFWSIFDQKLTSHRKGPFRTFSKPFVLWDLGDDSGFYAPLTPFFICFDFFYLFLFLSPFTPA